MKKPPVFALVGPTASGKTAAALEIARHFPIEIISVDSALIYRDMDVGTAKPTHAERAQVPHDLIDILDPAQNYSVAQFRADTLALIASIQSRAKLPLLVGGTMMYFNSLTHGLDELPESDAATRAELDALLAEEGVQALHQRLDQLDPASAARLKPTDTQRILRALEICKLSGQPMSALLSGKKARELPFELITFSLEPSDRAALHARIAMRFNAMLDAPEDEDLISEVRTLRARPDLHPDLPSMRCVGYRQAWQYLDGEIDFQELRERGIIATRQLAKRQLTWLRAMPERIVVDCLSSTPATTILPHIEHHLSPSK